MAFCKNFAYDKLAEFRNMTLRPCRRCGYYWWCWYSRARCIITNKPVMSHLGTGGNDLTTWQATFISFVICTCSTLSFSIVAKFAIRKFHRKDEPTEGDGCANLWYFYNHIDTKRGEINAVFVKAWLDNLIVEVHHICHHAIQEFTGQLHCCRFVENNNGFRTGKSIF